MLKKHDSKFNAFRIYLYINVSLLYTIENFHNSCLSVIGDDMAKDYGVEKKKMGVLSSLYFYLMAVMQLFAGLLCDIFDPVILVSLF